MAQTDPNMHERGTAENGMIVFYAELRNGLYRRMLGQNNTTNRLAVGRLKAPQPEVPRT